MAGKSDMLNATDYTSKLKSLFFSMSRFAAGLYKSLEDLGVTDKSIREMLDSHVFYPSR